MHDVGVLVPLDDEQRQVFVWAGAGEQQRQNGEPPITFSWTSFLDSGFTAYHPCATGLPLIIVQFRVDSLPFLEASCCSRGVISFIFITQTWVMADRSRNAPTLIRWCRILFTT